MCIPVLYVINVALFPRWQSISGGIADVHPSPVVVRGTQRSSALGALGRRERMTENRIDQCKRVCVVVRGSLYRTYCYIIIIIIIMLIALTAIDDILDTTTINSTVAAGGMTTPTPGD